MQIFSSRDFIVYRSLTTYRLWSYLLRFVYDNIQVYNVRECSVHLTEASPIDFVKNVHCIKWKFWGYHVGALRRLVVTTLYVLYSLFSRITQSYTRPASTLHCLPWNSQKNYLHIGKIRERICFINFEMTVL